MKQILVSGGTHIVFNLSGAHMDEHMDICYLLAHTPHTPCPLPLFTPHLGMAGQPGQRRPKPPSSAQGGCPKPGPPLSFTEKLATQNRSKPPLSVHLLERRSPSPSVPPMLPTHTQHTHFAQRLATVQRRAEAEKQKNRKRREKVEMGVRGGDGGNELAQEEEVSERSLRAQ